jgi:hypothetical protein
MSLTDEDKHWITELLDERLERVETNLLTAFHKWASPMEARQRTHSAAMRALDLEMEALDDRVKKLEPGQHPKRCPNSLTPSSPRRARIRAHARSDGDFAMCEHTGE